jgi:hypothetical protein
MKNIFIFMFYSNLDVNRTVKSELETKIDPKPLGPPRFLWGGFIFSRFALDIALRGF